MKINLSELSDFDLATLIRSAAAELQSRLSQEPIVTRVPAAERVVTVREPSESDKTYVLMLKSVLQRGGYVKAAERQRVATIAQQFPEWVRLQQLPTESGTAVWREAARFHSSKLPAEK